VGAPRATRVECCCSAIRSRPRRPYGLFALEWPHPPPVTTGNCAKFEGWDRLPLRLTVCSVPLLAGAARSIGPRWLLDPCGPGESIGGGWRGSVYDRAGGQRHGAQHQLLPEGGGDERTLRFDVPPPAPPQLAAQP